MGGSLQGEGELSALNPADLEAKLSACEPALRREGFTPLLPAKRLGAAWGIPHLYLKDERQNPTGSFKDRQASLAMSSLQARGVRALVVASTGNVGIAYAVPTGLPPGRARLRASPPPGRPHG